MHMCMRDSSVHGAAVANHAVVHRHSVPMLPEDLFQWELVQAGV